MTGKGRDANDGSMVSGEELDPALRLGAMVAMSSTTGARRNRSGHACVYTLLSRER
jgi:hypothetical protein